MQDVAMEKNGKHKQFSSIKKIIFVVNKQNSVETGFHTAFLFFPYLFRLGKQN